MPTGPLNLTVPPFPTLRPYRGNEEGNGGGSPRGIYVAAILAARLDGANQTLVELMIQVDYPRKMIGRTVEKMKDCWVLAVSISPMEAGYKLFN